MSFCGSFSGPVFTAHGTPSQTAGLFGQLTKHPFFPERTHKIYSLANEFSYSLFTPRKNVPLAPCLLTLPPRFSFSRDGLGIEICSTSCANQRPSAFFFFPISFFHDSETPLFLSSHLERHRRFFMDFRELVADRESVTSVLPVSSAAVGVSFS